MSLRIQPLGKTDYALAQNRQKDKDISSEKSTYSGIKTTETNGITVISDIFKGLADPNALYMFKNIAEGCEPSQGKLLSTRQFYISISKLKRAYLIVGQRGNYKLTSLGSEVRDALAQIETAVSLLSYLKAWDAIVASQDNIPDKQSMLQLLVKDEHIRHMLLKEQQQKQ
jgi:hypothetical protein